MTMAGAASLLVALPVLACCGGQMKASPPQPLEAPIMLPHRAEQMPMTQKPAPRQPKTLKKALDDAKDAARRLRDTNDSFDEATKPPPLHDLDSEPGP